MAQAASRAPGIPPADAAWAFPHCEVVVREGDRDRYLATLFAPADKRPYLHALYAFNHEIARVRETVSEALPGELRHQWWRDMLQGEARGDVKANPVAAALDATIVRFRLPRAAFAAMIDARAFDIYDDPMPTLGDLEGYCGETASALIRLASLILAGGADPGGAEAAGHAGVAYAMVGLLRALPWHAARGQVYLPLNMLQHHGLDRDDVVAGRSSPALLAVLAEFRDIAAAHARRVDALRAAIPAEAGPAFLPVALVPAYLARLRRPGYDPFRTPVDLPQWRKQLILWWAARGWGR